MNCPYETPKGQCKRNFRQRRDNLCPHEIEEQELKRWEYDTAMEHKRDERDNR